jgi:N-acetyl-anhydromuramyl-L-alanine amidase AmpD
MQRIRSIRTVSVVALVVAGIIAAVAIIAAPAFAATAPKPSIVKKYIRYGDGRKLQTIAYNKRHYHQRTYILKNARAIVLHHTAGADWRSAWWTFDGNAAYNGEKPGVSAQFIIHKDGTIYQTMPLNYRARHCIGMNWVSFGIEFVQETRPGKDGHWMDRQILKRTKQVNAGLRLVRWLQDRYGIKTSNVVGHATANGSPFFLDETGIKNAAGDWYSAEVKVFRSRL